MLGRAFHSITSLAGSVVSAVEEVVEEVGKKVEKEVTKVALNFDAAQDKVREKLLEQINEQFKTIDTKLDNAKKGFSADSALSNLAKTCDELKSQAAALKSFLLAKPQFEALTQILVSQGKVYGSVDDIKAKLKTSPAAISSKKLILELFSAEIYDSLLPLVAQAGSFDKLQACEQEKVITLLQNDDSLQKIKKLDLAKTFAELKVNADSLAKEFEIEEKQHQSINNMINAIETKFLPALIKIKSENEQYLPLLQEKLLNMAYSTRPDLAIDTKTKPKDVLVAKVQEVEKQKNQPVKVEKEQDKNKKEVTMQKKNTRKKM